MQHNVLSEQAFVLLAAVKLQEKATDQEQQLSAVSSVTCYMLRTGNTPFYCLPLSYCMEK
jgi:hypothetical protein